MTVEGVAGKVVPKSHSPARFSPEGEEGNHEAPLLGQGGGHGWCDFVTFLRIESRREGKRLMQRHLVINSDWSYYKLAY